MNRSLLKACQIFERLLRAEGPVGVNELARSLRMPKSTASRFLATLESVGLVRRDPESGRFYLGLRLFELGSKAIADLGLRKAAIPRMEALRDALNEDVLLTVLEDTHITYLDKMESRHPIVIQTNVGGTAPAHCVSSGKAMLAHHPERLEKVIREGPRRYTRHTLTDPERLRRECARIRQQGYALNRGEHHEGVMGVGAPIFNAAGEAVAAVSTATPAPRMTRKRWGEHIEAVTRAARAISRELGAPDDAGARGAGRGGRGG